MVPAKKQLVRKYVPAYAKSEEFTGVFSRCFMQINGCSIISATQWLHLSVDDACERKNTLCECAWFCDKTVVTNYKTMFNATLILLGNRPYCITCTLYTQKVLVYDLAFCLLSPLTALHCQKNLNTREKLSPHRHTFSLPWKWFPVFQSSAESMLFFLCFCLTSHRLPPLLAESRVIFFSGPLCQEEDVTLQTGTTKRLGEGRENLQRKKKHRNAARLKTQILTEPLFSTHRLRYATMHSKYNEEWLNQTERKQIWTRYSFLFLLVSPHFAACNLSSFCFPSCFFLFNIPFPRLNSVLQSYSLIRLSSICIPWGN